MAPPRSPSLSALLHLAGALAHEVRNPLNSMAIHVDLLESRLRKANVSDLQPFSRSLDTLGREIERIDRILEAFLEYAGAGEMVRRSTAMGELVRGVCERARERAKGIELRAQVEPAKLRWPIEAEGIALMLELLIDNALDASAPGAAVTVRLSEREGRGIIEVIDEGEGIEAEGLLRMFVFGYTTRPGRAGVGLSVARQIIKGHSGSIVAHSEGPGRGATVRVELPLAKPEK